MLRPPVRFSLAALLTFCFAGCAGIEWERSEVLEDGPLRVVEIEKAHPDPEVEPVVYGHPAEVSVDRVRAALDELHFEKLRLLNSDQTPPVVAPMHREPLAQAIATGLARCQPEERVRFRVENPDDALWILAGSSITRGVAFMDSDASLHLVFDLIGYKPDPDQPQVYRLWSDPTSRRVSRAALLPGSYHRPDGAHELWVAFREEGLSAPSGAVASDPPSAESAPAQPADSEPSTPEPAQPGASEPAEPDPKPLSDSERIARLRYLEELWKSGQLSDEAYQKERAALLDRAP